MNLARLATIYAIAERSIACTIIGMKCVEDVQKVVDIATQIYAISHQLSSSFNNNNMDDDKQQDNNSSNKNDDEIEIVRGEAFPNMYNILLQMFTKNELQAFTQIMDRNHGPFATLWKKEHNHQNRRLVRKKSCNKNRNSSGDLEENNDDDNDNNNSNTTVIEKGVGWNGVKIANDYWNNKKGGRDEASLQMRRLSSCGFEQGLCSDLLLRLVVCFEPQRRPFR